MQIVRQGSLQCSYVQCKLQPIEATVLLSQQAGVLSCKVLKSSFKQKRHGRRPVTILTPTLHLTQQ